MFHLSSLHLASDASPEAQQGCKGNGKGGLKNEELEAAGLTRDTLTCAFYTPTSERLGHAGGGICGANRAACGCCVPRQHVPTTFLHATQFAPVRAAAAAPPLLVKPCPSTSPTPLLTPPSLPTHHALPNQAEPLKGAGQRQSWKASYDTYGRCTATPDGVAYMATGLQLDQALPLPRELPGALQTAALAAAVEAAFGATPYITCKG